MIFLKPRRRRRRAPNYLRFDKINLVIKILIFSDLLVLSGFGLITPIFAVFITENISGGNLATVGVASAIYLGSKSLFQIPVAIFSDKIKGERDDFTFLMIGSLLFSLIPLAYIFITTPDMLYLVQFFYGAATALTIPTWYAIFTRHIDRNKEGVEWGAYNTLTDLGAAISASIGGFLALQLGFSKLFLVVCLFSVLGTTFLFVVKGEMKAPPQRKA